MDISVVDVAVASPGIESLMANSNRPCKHGASNSKAHFASMAVPTKRIESDVLPCDGSHERGIYPQTLQHCKL